MSGNVGLQGLLTKSDTRVSHKVRDFQHGLKCSLPLEKKKKVGLESCSSRGVRSDKRNQQCDGMRQSASSLRAPFSRKLWACVALSGHKLLGEQFERSCTSAVLVQQFDIRNLVDLAFSKVLHRTKPFRIRRVEIADLLDTRQSLLKGESRRPLTP